MSQTPSTTKTLAISELTAAPLHETVQRAQSALQVASWQEALELFGQASALSPNSAGLMHNLALCALALGRHKEALHASARALQLSPGLWQSYMVMGNAYKGLGDSERADLSFDRVLSLSAAQPEALVAKADLALNVFGNAPQARELVKPLLTQPEHAVDAQLTTLMASLYDRQEDALSLNRKILDFSQSHLRLREPGRASRVISEAVLQGRVRPRVGLISPLFNASPVYFLTIHGWRHVAKGCEIVVFNRGHKSDWATQEFKSLSAQWLDVQEMPAPQLAQCIANQGIDVLYDLGGWMDTIALKALSTKPAAKMFKWVGGQSVSTGLDVFDGWIGDPWQSPIQFQHLYSEPLVNISKGYCTYIKPDYFPTQAQIQRHKRQGKVVFSNPAKLSGAFLAHLASQPGDKVFIHHQFRFARTQARVLQALEGHRVEFITPSDHRQALLELSRFECMLDTFPYSSGLTAREAVALGLKVQARVGTLFCERHCAEHDSSVGA